MGAYDGDNLIEETNATGAVVARYSQGLNIDEPLAILRSSATSYYQADGLGSVTSLSNAAGAVAQNYTYDSFGNTIATTGSLVNSFRYTGREWDTETSLYYYRARYYDPVSGRFLSEDPVRFAGEDANFYRSVWNAPLSFPDPRGLDGTTGVVEPPVVAVVEAAAAGAAAGTAASAGATAGTSAPPLASSRVVRRLVAPLAPPWWQGG